MSDDRIASIDALRGFTMFCMFSTGFGLQYFAGNPMARQFEHSQWHGMTFWDLIQPFFMFIVGAVMPISFSRRWKAGETWRYSLQHVLWRSLLLLFCGEMARSFQARRPVLDLINVLAQLAFAYPVAFLTLRRAWRFQGGVAAGLLLFHGVLYQFGRGPGVTGAWVPDANFGWYLDGLVLGTHWGRHFGYATINCVSSTANVIFGVMAGAWLMERGVSGGRKIVWLVAFGVGGVAAGLALDPFVPIIKKLWTPSFALCSGGASLLMLALFYWICDVRKWTGWAKMFLIVGANSIFIYLFHETVAGYVSAGARRGLELVWVGPWSRFTAAWIVIAVHVGLCWALWRKRIFIRL